MSTVLLYIEQPSYQYYSDLLSLFYKYFPLFFFYMCIYFKCEAKYVICPKYVDRSTCFYILIFFLVKSISLVSTQMADFCDNVDLFIWSDLVLNSNIWCVISTVSTGQNLMCSIVHTHMSTSPVHEFVFTWIAPPSGTGCVSFL